jgi:hypothetical protein
LLTQTVIINGSKIIYFLFTVITHAYSTDTAAAVAAAAHTRRCHRTFARTHAPRTLLPLLACTPPPPLPARPHLTRSRLHVRTRTRTHTRTPAPAPAPALARRHPHSHAAATACTHAAVAAAAPSTLILHPAARCFHRHATRLHTHLARAPSQLLGGRISGEAETGTYSGEQGHGMVEISYSR